MRMYKKIMKATLLTGLLSTNLIAHAFWLFGNDTPTTKTQTQKHGSFNIEQEVNVLGDKAPNLSPRVLKLALTAYNNAMSMGYPVRKNMLTIIDYSLPDNNKRLWVLDLKHQRLLYNTFVAHGQGSGGTSAEYFSNQNQSHESSIGVFLTENSYYGSKGYALRLNGLDKGFNDHALSRDIVMHGAWYVNPAFAEQYGHIGRSWGCPSVPKTMIRPIVNAIKGGTLVFAYAPKYSWLHSSRFLQA